MTQLNCPHCSDIKLVHFSHEGVDFDFCNDSCLGIWTDKGEFAAYISEHEKNIPTPTQATLTDLACPRCVSNKLIQTKITNNSNTKVDLCISCNGIWFDKNELGEVKAELVKLGLGNKLSVTTKYLEEKGFSLLK
jgi:Zn-finger nucleic acid-binding protein